MEKTLYHTWLFLFGVIYYLIVPALVVASGIWKDYPGMDLLYSYYKGEYLLGYFILVFIISIPFFVGAYLPILCYKEFFYENKLVINSRGLLVISLPILLYSQYIIWSNRGYMFQGYLSSIDTPFIGTIATINMIFLFIFLYNKNGVYSKKINLILALVLLELSIVALGLGTRMYAMVTVFSIFIYLLDFNKVSLRKVILWVGGVIVFILFIGLWRMGNTNVTFEQLAYIGVAEPTFTWISVISMYDLNELPLLSFPSNFISSFYNFVPSSFLPDKTELISEITMNYDAPFGATSILLSLISNFGILGSMFALFCLGFLFSQIRLHWDTAFGKTYYYCICGIIPFQLFRDDFGIVNKQLFSNLLLVPLFMFILHRIMSLLATKVE